MSTYQLKTNLPSGTYALEAWVLNAGGQKACQLYAKNFGGPEKNAALPVTNTWTQIQITAIQVGNGQCEIGLWSDANAGNWCSLDNVELIPAAITVAAERAATSAAEAGAVSRLYPNPVADILTLTVPTRRETALVSIYSMTGQLILSQALASNAQSQRLNVAHLAAGVYQVRLVSGGRTEMHRFIKE